MLTGMRLQNFKAWRDTGDLQLAPITVIFGANSTGKTSLLQALLLMKQTVEANDRRMPLRTQMSPEGLDLGTLSEVVFRGEQCLTLDFRWDSSTPSAGDAHFTTTVCADGETNSVKGFQYTITENGLKRYEAGMNRGSADDYEVIFKKDGKPCLRKRGRPVKGLRPVKCYDFPSEAVSAYQLEEDAQALNDIVVGFEAQLRRLTYLGPLREPPQRIYNWSGERPQDVGRRGELAIAAYLALSADEKKVSSRHQRAKTPAARIRHWLGEMGLLHGFQVDALRKGAVQHEVKVRRTPTSPQVTLPDVGFGISQILPVLVLCYYAEPGSTLLLEQPELHLHPSVQSLLADMLIEVVQNRAIQLIIESHSDYLLTRLQRRIAEQVLPSDHLRAYFTQTDGDSIAIERLAIDIFGEIRNWPHDFFGDKLGDAFAIRQNAIRRQKEQSAR